MSEKKSYSAVLTVTGCDKPGIIAEVTGILASHKVNILDISQTIVSDIFNMIMLINTEEIDISFDELDRLLDSKAKEIQCKIILQQKDVFQAMHRI